MTGRLRIAIDSNILISAVRSRAGRLRVLWELPNIDILVSRFVIEEVRRHLVQPEQRARLWQALYDSHLIPDGEEVVLPASISLPAKDLPVLQAAVAGRADLLVSGDIRHFGALFGSRIEGVLIERTSEFQARYPEYFEPRGNEA